MEARINGESSGHSASVNASASVPFSQLWCQDRLRTCRGSRSGESSGLPLRRYVDGIVSHEAQNGPVQSEIRASHGGRGDESREEDDCSVDIVNETPKHLPG